MSPQPANAPASKSPAVDPAREPPRPSLINEIVVDHGPRDLLGRFFLKADTVARDRGITLSFGTFDDLVETNARNAASWHPLIPLFDPKNGSLTDDSAFCLVGRNPQGDIVATQAARLYRWPDTSFYEEARSLRLFYADPARMKMPKERCEISAESTKFVSGNVCFSGGGWYRRDYRKLNLSAILPRISRALAFTRWRTDYTVSVIAEKVIQGGMADRSGYTNVDWDLRMYDAPPGTVRCAFVWMETNQLLSDLADFLVGFDAQVDVGIDQRRA
jgi:hypothetical protein